MVARLLGKRPLDFTDDKGGQVVGVQLHVARPASDEEKAQGVTGDLVDKVFISQSKGIDTSRLTIGSQYQFLYDLAGRNRAVLIGIKPVS